MAAEITPYNGREPFATLLYAPQDWDSLRPQLERLQEGGLRMWLRLPREEENPGETIVGDHLSHSVAVLAFVTERSVMNHRFRQRLTAALEQKQTVIAMVAAGVQLLPGMTLQLRRCVRLSCGDPMGPEDTRALLALPQLAQAIGEARELYDEETTTLLETAAPLLLLLPETGRCVQHTGTVVIGRGADAGLLLAQQNVSRRHASVTVHGGTITVTDLSSSYGTALDDVPIPRGGMASAREFCELRLAGHPVLAAAGGCARLLWQTREAACVTCVDTGETHWLVPGDLKLGRQQPWHNGVLKTASVSREHADVIRLGSGWGLAEHSTHGTLVNGSMVRGCTVPLQDGDRLRIGEFSFVFRRYTFREG